MKKLYLIMLVLAGFALQASASVTYTMLSATKTGGNEGAEKLLDGQGSTKWGETLNNGNSRWIVFKASAGIMPSDYVLTVANDTPGNSGRQWKTWRIYGANFVNDFCATRDANGWVLLDSKQNITNEQFPTGSSNQTYLQTTFSLSEGCSTYYEYFKIEVDEIRSSGQYMQMGDFAFGTYTEQTTAELYGVKVNLAKNLDMTGLDESDVWSLEAPVIIGGLDEAYANAQNSGDYSALQSSLDVAVKLSTGIARLVSNGNISAFDGSACWGDGHYTQLFDGKDGISSNDGTKWGGNFSGNEGDAAHVQYVIFRVKEAFAPYFYKLVTGGDTERFNGRNWKTWSVYGANFASIADATRDADGWVELDKRENISEEYLPMKNNYPAAFNFLSGVSEPYLYYMVKVFAAHNGNQTQMNEMYLCTQEEFDAARAPLVAYFDDFDLTSLVTEDGLDEEKATFAEKLELLKTTSDAVEMTKLYNELVALREMLEESAAFMAGGYRTVAGNTAWGNNENWTKLVDGDINTKWGGNMPTDGTGSYIIFKTNEANAFNQYMLVTGNDTGNGGGARNWKTWKIYGIDAADEASVVRDAEGWTLIDEKTDIGQDRLPAANFAPAYFNFTNPQGFKYFKIEVASAYSGGSIQMAEFKMLSDEAYAAERQVYVDSLQKVALAKFAEYADVEVPAAVMQAIQAAATAKMNAVATATADDLLPAFNAALNFINVEALEMAAAAIPEKVDGVYQIANAMQLVYFQGAVNAGEVDADAVLVDDIDMTGVAWTNPIGNWATVDGASIAYKGHFDGQGHKIENLVYTTAKNYHGLFGVLSAGSVVENFSIGGTITNASYDAIAAIGYTRDESVTIRNIHSYLNISNSGNDKKIGGILGNGNVGTTYVDRCTFSGTLSTSIKANVGGIAGYIQNNNTTYVNFSNCLFEGTITAASDATTAYCGGIVGYIGANSNRYTIKNCLSVGTITAPVAGSILGYVRNKGSEFSNNYYLGVNSNGKVGDNCSATDNLATLVTVEQLASGEITYLLNEQKSHADVAWFQTLIVPKVYLAEQYVATTDGTEQEPTTANVTLTEAFDGTYTFTLPEFALSFMGMTLPVGDISLEGVEIAEDGTFSKSDTYSVPDENIPAELSAYARFFKSIPYTLTGKVNDNKLYAVIDMTVSMGADHTVNVVAGVDDFEAVAPALTTGDPCPVLDATHGIVYLMGQLHCDGTAYETVTPAYSNDPSATVQDEHDFVDGFCSYCGEIDESYMTPNADGFYEIANAKQLRWFAGCVNKINDAANGLVVDDIDLSEVIVDNELKFSIGTNAVPFTGVFDGQRYAISNINYTAKGQYNGLFGKIANGAVVKDFDAYGTITVSTAVTGRAVSLIAVAGGEDVLISGIFSNVTFYNQLAGAQVGGILGGALNGHTTVDRCQYSGYLDGNDAGGSGNYGGIAGYANNDANCYLTISNCLFDGELDNNATSPGGCTFGGMVGYSNGAHVTIKNCLSIGTINSPVQGQFFGAVKSTRSSITNSYYQGNAVNGSASTVTLNPQDATEVTDDQLASGFVAARLAPAFRQNIGTDEYPDLNRAKPIVAEITDAGYATLYQEETDVIIPDGVEVFAGEKNAEATRLMLLPLTTAFAAGEPVILRGETGYYMFRPTTGAAKAETNDLKGTAEDIPAEGLYILAKPDEESEVAFYHAVSGTLRAGKAYLEDASGIKAFFFEGEDATGIAEVETALENGAIYNVAGQRLGKMQKGINIVGNKKVLK